MSSVAEQRRKMLFGVAATATGLGLCYAAYRNRAKISDTFRQIVDFRNPLSHKTVEIVDNVDDCQRIVKLLRQHCNEYKVLGFDCEWVTVTGKRRPTALLQLASHRGLCALIRLCEFKTFPKGLKELLEDDDVLKVGVAPFDDAQNLCHDYGLGVASTLDLRFLALLTNVKPESLSKLSKNILNVELDKNWRVRCSNWEAKELTEKQVDYAAKDALVAIEIFKNLSNRLFPRNFWEAKVPWTQMMNTFETFVDIRYKDGLVFPNSSKKTKLNSSKSGLTGVQRNPINKNFCTRASKLYDNCLLEAPDGDILCTCHKKKAQWYIDRDLGVLISEEPFTVRLNFEPQGRSVGEVGKFYTIAKDNQCVVCGQQNAYIRKYVVPREYRKNFPAVMKTHTSHDVLLLCPHCHQVSNISDLKMRSKLANMCDAPFMNEKNDEQVIRKYTEDPKLKKLKSAAKALLLNSHKIPEERIKILKDVITEHYPDEEITTELLETAANIETLEQNENYVSHGEKVVKEFQQNHGGLLKLEKMWREHFLHKMQPKFLPELWSVNHNADRLEIKATEGRMEESDILLVGLPERKIEKL